MLQKNIKKRRLALGLTLEEVANSMGLSKSTIYKYENGDIHNIDTKTIVKLANVLQCSPSQLVGWNSLSNDMTINPLLKSIINECELLSNEQLSIILSTLKMYKSTWESAV